MASGWSPEKLYTFSESLGLQNRPKIEMRPTGALKYISSVAFGSFLRLVRSGSPKTGTIPRLRSPPSLDLRASRHPEPVQGNLLRSAQSALAQNHGCPLFWLSSEGGSEDRNYHHHPFQFEKTAYSCPKPNPSGDGIGQGVPCSILK